MSKHLPECPTAWMQDCICPELRMCEERVRHGMKSLAHLYEQNAYMRGWIEALDAVAAAIAEQKIVPLAKQRRFIITRNTKLWDDRQSWAEYGWWSHRASSLAAIDALRTTDTPPTSPAKAKPADLHDPQMGEMIHGDR